MPGPAGRAVELLIPSAIDSRRPTDVVIHFHGAPWLAMQAVERVRPQAALVSVHLGAGSGAYQRPFSEPAAFDSLVAAVERELTNAAAREVRLGRLVLTGFSAGHGAIRAILRDERHRARVHGVLLLDGMHTAYIPDGGLLSTGATLDTTNLVALSAFAERAIQRSARMIITHSEIFPGTFASTTETADWLLARHGIRREPVLRWGPRGMQQTSEARRGGFALLGFAGNSAPDHVDHLHAMPELLRRLFER